MMSCMLLQGRNVLKKEPMGKDISDRDVFSFNEEFTNKLYKIKIATVSAQKESEPEKLETRHKVRFTQLGKRSKSQQQATTSSNKVHYAC